MTPLLAVLLLAAPAPPPDPPAAGPAEVPAPGPVVDERTEAFERFVGHFKAGQYYEALPFAKRVVELTEAMADRDAELPTAYNNLAATHLSLQEYAAAGEYYGKSLELLEATQGIASRRLIGPLAGLAAVHVGEDQRGTAAEYYARALAVSRRADGLFNLEQLPLIDQAAQNLAALADYDGAEREYRYALKVAEQNFGYGDVRTLPALQQLATFYEQRNEYVAARNMYLRARDATQQEGGGSSPETIRALLGVARTHRMQLMMNPEVLDAQQIADEEDRGEALSREQRKLRSFAPVKDRMGLAAAQTALEMLRAATDPPARLLLETQIEIGDWYLTMSRPDIAMTHYEEAAAIHAAATAEGLPDPLAVPTLIFYRPPLAAIRSASVADERYLVRRTTFEFSVAIDGHPHSILVVESDMSEGQLSQSRRALARALYRPRFENGKAVASDGVRFTSEWSELAAPENPPAAPEAAAPG
jgi:tetratricopeptide (TPR) repeat protein